LEKSRKDILKRLGIAGAFGMQVMGLAISLYLDDGSMDKSIKLLMQRASFILCLPVIFYAAQPFFQGALKDLKNGRFGMDTPVALGISLAFLASVLTLLTGRGEIYFDSVCMFTFLLLAARYLLMSARKRAADNADIAHQSTPVMARKLETDGSIHSLPALELELGDQVVIHAGDIVPADAQVISGQSSLDESILTGENMPKLKRVGDQLIGGSLNVDSPITAKIIRIGNDTVLSGIQQLLDKAQQAKPVIAQLADRIAGWFVLGVLSLATLTGLYWFLNAPQDWLAPTIAVLIVSCPCALSLATPASITTAIGQLMQQGVVISNKTALESLHQLDVMIFDKTGTLTKGEFEISEYQLLN
ncbi:MAG: cation-translocating P-type ATPase, partial [Methylococcales bacterium]|nr:cation-translocating P-type ATPase [Methylococcales bacterium]